MAVRCRLLGSFHSVAPAAGVTQNGCWSAAPRSTASRTLRIRFLARAAHPGPTPAGPRSAPLRVGPHPTRLTSGWCGSQCSWRDSNSRHPGCRPGALARLSYASRRSVRQTDQRTQRESNPRPPDSESGALSAGRWVQEEWGHRGIRPAHRSCSAGRCPSRTGTSALWSEQDSNLHSAGLHRPHCRRAMASPAPTRAVVVSPSAECGALDCRPLSRCCRPRAARGIRRDSNPLQPAPQAGASPIGLVHHAPNCFSGVVPPAGVEPALSRPSTVSLCQLG